MHLAKQNKNSHLQKKAHQIASLQNQICEGKNIKLNEELWDELNLPDDLKNKIKIRVRMEIKTFLRDNLIPIMEKIIRRI